MHVRNHSLILAEPLFISGSCLVVPATPQQVAPGSREEKDGEEGGKGGSGDQGELGPTTLDDQGQDGSAQECNLVRDLDEENGAAASSDRRGVEGGNIWPLHTGWRNRSCSSWRQHMKLQPGVLVSIKAEAAPTCT